MDVAYAAVLPMPLTQVFRRRFAALPPVKEVRDQVGAWGTVGQARTIVLADRGTMRETLTTASPGASFGYHLEPLTGPFAPLVSGVEGTWDFAPAGNGVEVSWQWVVQPTRAGTLAMPLVARMWQGYARQALEEVERALLAR